MVPVVYGLANYSTIAPAHSFINTKDFKSVKDLATYLLHLDKHPREYLKYFRWRKRFRVLDTFTGDNDLGDLTWCEFCTKLHATDISKSRKWYDNLEEWYRRNYTNSSVCTVRRHTRKFRRQIKWDFRNRSRQQKKEYLGVDGKYTY
jgi:hypothetical protein